MHEQELLRVVGNIVLLLDVGVVLHVKLSPSDIEVCGVLDVGVGLEPVWLEVSAPGGAVGVPEVDQEILEVRDGTIKDGVIEDEDTILLSGIDVESPCVLSRVGEVDP